MQNLSGKLNDVSESIGENDDLLSKMDVSRMSSFFSTLRWQEAYELDPDGIITSSNLEIVNVTGYEESEVIGKHFSIFYLPEEIACDRPRHDLAEAAHRNRTVSDGIKLKKKNIPFFARFRIAAHPDNVGRILGYKVILSELTQKAAYSQRFKKLKLEYQHLFENSCVGILKFNMEQGRIILQNQYAEDLLNVKAGMNLAEAFARENEYHDLLRNLKISGYVNGFEVQLKKTDTYDFRWIAIECKDLGFDGLIEAILFDITSIKKAEAEVQRLQAELDSFIYSASHDLRAPITTVQGLLNLIDLVKDVNEIPAYTKMVKEKVNELDYLLKHLSTIASNNTTDIHIEAIVLKRECENIIKEFSTQHESLTVTLEVVQNGSFYSDILRLRTILRCLLSNAIKFAKPGTSSTIRIAATVDCNKCMLTFEDDGVGIEDVQLLRIYNLFYKGQNSRSGAGLGLYITKEMIDKLKGKIYVKSSLGVGTTFTVELPNSWVSH